MAKRRPRKGGKPDGKQKDGAGFFRKYLYEILLGFIAGITLIAILLLASGVMTSKGPPPKPDMRAGEGKGTAGRDHEAKKAPPFKPSPAQTAKIEPHGKPDTPAPAPAATPTSRGTIAIIIDDLGADTEPAKKLTGLNTPIAFAVLPHLKRSREVAEIAHTAGMIVMLHLPMESKWKAVNPGPGALMTTQSEADIVKAVSEDISAVPYAAGTNNHMGSAFTEDAMRTETALREIKKRGLFFVDSRTTPASTAFISASKLRMPAAGRDVFLDNERDKKKIVEQITALARLSLKKGKAIGIGHPYPQTIEALAEALPAVRAMGVEIAPVTELLERGGY